MADGWTISLSGHLSDGIWLMDTYGISLLYEFYNQTMPNFGCKHTNIFAPVITNHTWNVTPTKMEVNQQKMCPFLRYSKTQVIFTCSHWIYSRLSTLCADFGMFEPVNKHTVYWICARVRFDHRPGMFIWWSVDLKLLGKRKYWI